MVGEENNQAVLLITIPGISYLSALLLIAEIGDIDRFCSFKKLCSYAGLVPTTDQSADKFHQEDTFGAEMRALLNSGCIKSFKGL